MDDEREINWLAIFLKIIIVFLISIIIIWFLSKIFTGNKKTCNYDYNIEEMSNYSYEYFKGIDLPTDDNNYLIMSLEEMLNHDFFNFKNIKEMKKCNVDYSYSKIKKEKSNYIVETKLICGKKNKTVEKIMQIDEYAEDSNKKNESENNDNSNNNKIKYYEYQKEEIKYGPWIKGNLKSPNIENKNEYYAIDYYTYYTLGYIPRNKSEFSYILKLNKVPNRNYYFVSEQSSSYINSEEFSKCEKDRNVSLLNNDLNIPRDSYKYILLEDNFTYNIYPYYKDNNFYLRIDIKIRNSNNISSYYDKDIKEDIYLVPIKLSLKFSSGKATTSKPNSKYDVIPYYRIIDKKIDTIWSKEEYIDGYRKTGKTEMR